MNPEQNQTTQGQPQWQYVADEVPGQQMSAQPSDEISWSASEFVAYHKSMGWYALMILAIIVLAGFVFLVTNGDIISVVSIFLIGMLFLAFASRKPRTLNYRINKDGVTVGEKLYSFSTIKSFAVIDEGSLHSIMLIPIQRFLPAISLYFDPQEEQKIVETLGGYLPHEERKQDAIDRLMHKIRF